jgi:hypothetical protein
MVADPGRWESPHRNSVVARSAVETVRVDAQPLDQRAREEEGVLRITAGRAAARKMLSLAGNSRSAQSPLSGVLGSGRIFITLTAGTLKRVWESSRRGKQAGCGVVGEGRSS